jgi:hypothetical protein
MFILGGDQCQDPLNPGTYIIKSSAFTTVTTITIETDTAVEPYARSFNSSETVAASTMVPDTLGTPALIYSQERDWSVGTAGSIQDPRGGVSGPASRGYFRITQPTTTLGVGVILVPGNVRVFYALASGAGFSHIPYIRQIRPQSLSAVTRAKVWLYVGLENDSRAYVREFDASITPSGMNLGDGSDFADMTLTIKVLTDLMSAEPGGRMYYFEGDTHDLSGLR